MQRAARDDKTADMLRKMARKADQLRGEITGSSALVAANTSSHRTPRWSGMDSKFQYRGK
jgi:hypothetical protein